MVLTRTITLLAFLTLGLSACVDPDDTNEAQNLRHSDAADDHTDLGVLGVEIPALLSIGHYQQLLENKSEVLLIDMRETNDYVLGHIPNAFQLWRTDIQSNNYPYEGMAKEAEDLADILASFGANDSSHIVIYDGVGGCDAARLWWLLKLYGHDAVSLLDGGWSAWNFFGHPAEQAETPRHLRGNLTLSKIEKPHLLTSYEDLSVVLNDTNVVLLDTRSLEEHTGEIMKPGAFFPGHIPGSVHFDWGRSVDMNDDFPLRPNEEILAALAECGVTPNKRVITYCHSGVRSAHTTFVLSELLRFPQVSNYDGSWTEWSYLNQTNKAAEIIHSSKKLYN